MPQIDLDTIFTTRVTLRSGQEAAIRPLRQEDGAKLGAYLEGLSEATQSRWRPHDLDRATAEAICAALDPGDWIRIVAETAETNETNETAEEDGGRIIAYMLLKPGVPEGDAQRCRADGFPADQSTDCTFAPSVADDYQDQGLGSLILSHMIACARQMGRQRMILLGGVQASNDRAVHFYQKAGFRKVGEFFTDKNNYNMIRDL